MRAFENLVSWEGFKRLCRHHRGGCWRQGEWLGFLSRYKKKTGQQAAATTYRFIVARAADFLAFVKAWATLLGQLGIDDSLRA